MQNPNTIPGFDDSANTIDPGGLNVTPLSPSITPKPGWTTSQGQMTATFTIVCLLLSIIGFHYTPEQLQGWADSIEHISSIVGPLLAGMVTLVGYTMGRSQVYSAAALATAQVQASLSPTPLSLMSAKITPGSVVGAGLDVLQHGGLAGKGWKDPARYQNLIHIASEAGVPGANTVDAIQQQVPAEDIITSLLGLFHKKTKNLP